MLIGQIISHGSSLGENNTMWVIAGSMPDEDLVPEKNFNANIVF